LQLLATPQNGPLLICQEYLRRVGLSQSVAWKIAYKWTSIKVQMEKEEHFRATDV